ncbi:DUF1534 domain-containing protein, partial [Pseudomonas syringae]|nr:DUF1534 domain-containing protein [Pseudomonas syringae]
LRLSFRTLQRGNACRDAPRHKICAAPNPDQPRHQALFNVPFATENSPLIFY